MIFFCLALSTGGLIYKIALTSTQNLKCTEDLRLGALRTVEIISKHIYLRETPSNLIIPK